MSNFLKPIKESAERQASAYRQGMAAGFGPTESDLSKKMEAQQKAQLAVRGGIAKALGKRPGLTSAKGVQAPIDMSVIAQQRGGIAEAEQKGAELVRSTEEKAQTMGERMEEKIRARLLEEAKRKADARQRVFDNSMAMGELGVTAAGEFLP